MTTTHDTLRELTGDFYDDLVAKIGTDGIDDLVRALDLIDERYDDGEPGATAEHWNGALMVAYGDETLANLGRVYRETHARLRGAITYGAATGVPEAQLVRESGLSRMTVRKAMGL